MRTYLKHIWNSNQWKPYSDKTDVTVSALTLCAHVVVHVGSLTGCNDLSLRKFNFKIQSNGKSTKNPIRREKGLRPNKRGGAESLHLFGSPPLSHTQTLKLMLNADMTDWVVARLSFEHLNLTIVSVLRLYQSFWPSYETLKLSLMSSVDHSALLLFHLKSRSTCGNTSTFH